MLQEKAWRIAQTERREEKRSEDEKKREEKKREEKRRKEKKREEKRRKKNTSETESRKNITTTPTTLITKHVHMCKKPHELTPRGKGSP